MNRYLTSLTALALLAACQDSTAPRPEALEQGGLAPDAIARRRSSPPVRRPRSPRATCGPWSTRTAPSPAAAGSPV